MNDSTLHDLRNTEDGHQERNLISPDRPPVNDGLPHHEFVPSEFAPESGRCDKCGGGPAAPVHQKPVDQMERIADQLEDIDTAIELTGGTGLPLLVRIADALERIADVLEDAEQTAADRLGANSINNLLRGLKPVFAPHDFIPMAIGSIVCSWCGEHRDDGRHHAMKQGAM